MARTALLFVVPALLLGISWFGLETGDRHGIAAAGMALLALLPALAPTWRTRLAAALLVTPVALVARVRRAVLARVPRRRRRRPRRRACSRSTTSRSRSRPARSRSCTAPCSRRSSPSASWSRSAWPRAGRSSRHSGSGRRRRVAGDARRHREPDRPRRADPRRRAVAAGVGRAPARAVAAARAPRRRGGRARRRRRRRAARGREGRVPRLEGLGPVRPAGGPGRRRLRLGRELRRDRVPVRAHGRAHGHRAPAGPVLARGDPERLPRRPLGRGAVDHRDQRRRAGPLERPVPAGPRADDLPARPRERRDQGAPRRPSRRAGDAARPRPARDRARSSTATATSPSSTAGSSGATSTRSGATCRARARASWRACRSGIDRRNTLESDFLEILPGFDVPPLGSEDRQARVLSLTENERVGETVRRYLPLYRRAQSVTRGARTQYAVVIALESWFRSGGGFRYTEAPPGLRSGAPPLVDFVERTKAGYCQHYAGAMALMLRYLGIPARVAVGFTSGDYDEDNRRWTVTDHDAHAWVEVWFEGWGWLPFDPTPTRGAVSSPYSTASSNPAVQTAIADLLRQELRRNVAPSGPAEGTQARGGPRRPGRPRRHGHRRGTQGREPAEAPRAAGRARARRGRPREAGAPPGALPDPRSAPGRARRSRGARRVPPRPGAARAPQRDSARAGRAPRPRAPDRRLRVRGRPRGGALRPAGPGRRGVARRPGASCARSSGCSASG